MVGKRMYYLLIKLLNQNKLTDWVDTLWRAHLALTEAQRPEWRVLCKPLLTKRVGDLQWRVVHGVVAVHAFVSVINSDVADLGPFCPQRETVFLCFLECGRLSSLFQFLTQMFALFDEVFPRHLFIHSSITGQRKWNVNLFIFLWVKQKWQFILAWKTSLKTRLILT